MEPIFSDNFLSHYLSEFKLASVTDVRGITQIVKSLILELDSGKLETLKEEEVKSRFINNLFGNVLGFNYGNSNEWQLKEETKSRVDGKKSDAALGYFYSKKEKNSDVRAVIEMKNANTDLDKPQNRKGNQTSVEQAFSYAHKMGGTCKWVIVSNMKETRFYASNDSSKYQVFFLRDLANENKLKELLLLFHKDRIIKKLDKSRTDVLLERSKLFTAEQEQPLHIIDKVDKCVKRFKGFGFVDPEFIVTIYPFNILDEHVWQYSGRNLFTINPEIFNLMQGVSIENNEVVFTDELKAEIEAANIVDAKAKLENAFRFLNHSLIEEITAIKDYKQVEQRNKKTLGFNHRIQFNFKEGVEGITKNIQIVNSKACDCLICNYRSLKFSALLEKLKVGFGNDDLNNGEYAYGNYLAATNNFKTSYSIYKAIEKEIKGKEGYEVEYFLTKQNIRYLHNLILDYPYDDGKEILSDIKAVDLDKVIYDEIEFSVDKEVKDYLVDVKDDSLIYKVQDKIEEITFKIDQLKKLYDNGGVQYAGPNLPNELFQAYYSLYLHVNRNYIVYDVFTRYKTLTAKVFRGFIVSYQTKEVGLKKFNEFLLTEAILHINPSDLQEILKEVDVINTDDECVVKLLEKLNNFTASYHRDSFFGDPVKSDLLEEYLKNSRFKENFTDIFSNLFTVFTKLEISKEEFGNSKKAVLKYLKTETELAWYDIKQFAKFLAQKGYLFDAGELIEILKIAIDGDEFGFNKYNDLIETTSRAISKFYPDYRIDNVKLIQTAILKCKSDNGNQSNYMHLVHLVRVCADNCSQILLNTFEIQLDSKFNSNLYEALIENAGYDWSSKNYFQIYSDHVNRSKGGRAHKFGKQELTDLVFIHYAYLVYKLNIDFGRNEFKSFTNLNNFETWLLNPSEFDYGKFDAKWLTDLDDPIFLNRLKNSTEIKSALDMELKNSFEPILAGIRYNHFTN
ncbi:MAG TPA: hypothetical protein VE978_26290 [Chitinophagales bacterium]|nr:hypothetical protein [Chitinophagales bacterium]